MLYEVKEGQIVLEQFFYQASRPYRRPARRRTPADCYPLIAEAGKPLLPATGQRHALVMRKVEQLSNGRVNIGLRYR